MIPIPSWFLPGAPILVRKAGFLVCLAAALAPIVAILYALDL